LDGGGAGRPDPGQGAELRLCARGKSSQIARACEQVVRDLDDVLALSTRPEQNGQQLGVGQAAGTPGQQPLARAIFYCECKDGRHARPPKHAPCQPGIQGQTKAGPRPEHGQTMARP
jgi:hypothetical protein